MSAFQDIDLDSDVAEYALRLGDDALITGQRLCEWCSNAPTLEEDLALANTALDYLGRARFLLTHSGTLVGKSADELAFQRSSEAFRNLLLVELPLGDFAFTMVRQYLLDEFELLLFTALSDSGDETLAAISSKTLKEIHYHLRRSKEWMYRLGMGSVESHQRTQRAINEIWGYVHELFEMDDLDHRLVAAEIGVDRAKLKDPWDERIQSVMKKADLRIPSEEWEITGGRSGIHTENLDHLLVEMQFLQRAYPGQAW